MLPGTRSTLLVLANTITLIIMLIANYLANTGSFFPATVAEISQRYPSLFTPAGYAFSIWSVIFAGCIGFTIFQWHLVYNSKNTLIIKQTGIWFLVSNLCNAAWLVAWTTNNIGYSVILIMALLLSLCRLVVRLRLELDQVSKKVIVLVWWPITIYTGWVMVASIACIAAWLVSVNWNGWNVAESTWAIAMLVIAGIIYILLVTNRHLREAAMVGIWAFIAIAVKQWHDNNAVAVAAILVSIILLVIIIIQAYQHRSSNAFFSKL